MGWEEAGVAWGARALDWAYLMEPLFVGLYDRLVLEAQIGPGAAVLDVGCGAGRALQTYATHGATVSGVDASGELLKIARLRVPAAELRQGPMTELPWPDGSFTHATGVNAFVYSDDGALERVRQVLCPGGVLAIGFWTDPGDFAGPMGLLGEALAPYVQPEQTHTPLRISDLDVARDLLSAAGFDVQQNGSITATSEFPDIDVAYRALASTGMMYPIVHDAAEAPLRSRTIDLLRRLQRPGAGVRMTAKFGWLIARRL